MLFRQPQPRTFVSLLLLLFYLILSIYHPIESPVPDNQQQQVQVQEEEEEQEPQQQKTCIMYVCNIFSRVRCMHHRFPFPVPHLPFPVLFS